MERRFGLILVLSICAVGAAAQDGPWRAVRGKALQELFADQDLGDGVHYAYQFHRDGQLTGMLMGKSEHGTWRGVPSGLCYVWSRRKSEEECYEVRRRGNEVRMLRDGYEALSGTLTPIPNHPLKEKQP